MLHFYFKQMQVTPQYAHIIDEYFDKYGYATKRVKVPNTHSRPHWTYTKTQNCELIGNSCSNNDVTAIKNIFDSTQSEEIIVLSSEQIEMLSMSEKDIEDGKLVSEPELSKRDSKWLS